MNIKNILGAIALLGATIPSAADTSNIDIVTDNLQLTFEVKDNGRMYQAYFGQRLWHTESSALRMPLTAITTSNIKGCETYPVMGTEDYYEPAFEICHADGNPTSVLKYAGHERKDNETIVRLKDEVYPVEVTLHYATYPSDNIIKTWTEISHSEKGDVYINRYASSMLYMESKEYWLRQVCGDWGREMQLVDNKLEFGRKVLSSRLGTRAAMYSQPYFILSLDEKAKEESGTVLMGALGWTGNTQFVFDLDHNNILRISSGINPEASRYKLKKGEVFRTPDFVFTLSDCGVGEGSRRFQRWMLTNQLHNGGGDRITLLNNWEYTSFGFNEEKICNIIDEAKQLGVDLFLLDDGWFGNKYPRDNARQGLGDWQTMKKKLPGGIKVLVDKAEANGIAFGIWIEPEMVNPKSELAEQHPDWIIQLPKRDTYYLRNQLVLDMTNPKVQDYVFSVVDNLMKENPRIKYFKWDCNSPITNTFSSYEGREQGRLYVDYVRGLYSVLERVRAAYPNITMMLCASGGSRCDIEALRYFDEYWVSDDTDPVERLYIQWGCSHFLPTKAMCAHVTDWNKRSNVKFRTDVAMSCKLGFDIALNKLSAEDREYCRMATKEWNRLKDIIFSPNLYRLQSPYESDHCVVQRVNDDKTRALVFAYDIHPRFRESIMPIKLQGLDASAIYEVREICQATGQKPMDWHEKSFSGEYLMTVGLKMTTEKDMQSRIIEITRKGS
ncbi:MAG: alpha-galactosidase [Prevotella sp.]